MVSSSSRSCSPAWRCRPFTAADPTFWSAVDGGIQVAVRVTPRAGRNGLAGLWHDAAGRCYLAVKVAAAPADGAANDAVRALLAKGLGLARGDVVLAHGATAREKRFRLAGDPAALTAKLLELEQAG